jgi:hypothetical protein
MAPSGFDGIKSDLALKKWKKNDKNYPQNSRKKVSNSRKKRQTPATPEKSYEWNFHEFSRLTHFERKCRFSVENSLGDPKFTNQRAVYCSGD